MEEGEEGLMVREDEVSVESKLKVAIIFKLFNVVIVLACRKTCIL